MTGSGTRRWVHACDPAEVPRIRNAVVDFAQGWDVLDPVALEGLRLVTSELAANVVQHAYRGMTPGPIEVELSIGTQVELVVRDHGVGMQPRPSLACEGLGLTLAMSLTDDLEISPLPGGGTEVRAIFELEA